MASMHHVHTYSTLNAKMRLSYRVIQLYRATSCLAQHYNIRSVVRPLLPSHSLESDGDPDLTTPLDSNSIGVTTSSAACLIWWSQVCRNHHLPTCFVLAPPPHPPTCEILLASAKCFLTLGDTRFRLAFLDKFSECFVDTNNGHSTFSRTRSASNPLRHL